MSKPAKIQKLDETVVNRIAAGEVIQRPANALKELIENSLDAKANNINITVNHGGLKVLQIQDNGTGIRKEDMGIVCERFTTSKLQQLDDLKSIGTFGFRGEALASISHVAHLTITTKTRDDLSAYKASYIDGKLIGPPKPCAGSQGTTILIENLFYNVTTRRNALKSHNEEFMKIAEVVNKYAIHNPRVGFILRKHGETIPYVRTPYNSTKVDNIKTIFSSNVARELMEVQYTDNTYQFKLHGLVTNANYSTKKFTLLLFINHRLVGSTLIRKMLEDLYSLYLPKKSHPWCYLSLEINPTNIDVNVHPTKHEVRFLHEEAIIEKVKLVLSTKLVENNTSRSFYAQGRLPQVDISNRTLQKVLPKYSQDKTATIHAYHTVRTDSNDQKLEKFNFSVCSARNRSENSSSASDVNVSSKSSRNHNLKKNVMIDDYTVKKHCSTENVSNPPKETAHVENNILNKDSRIEILSGLTEVKFSDCSTVSATKLDDSETGPSSKQSHSYSESRIVSKQVQKSASPNSNQSNIEDQLTSSTIKFKAYSVNTLWKEVKLSSILTLRKNIEDQYHEGLRDILSNLIFVGSIDETFALIQSGVHLHICNTQKLLEELFYEIMLYGFENYGVIELSEPVSLIDLAMLGLEFEEAGWTIEDGPKQELAAKVQEKLFEKADMLNEYFSIIISNGMLKTLPILIDKYLPSRVAMPLYVLRLATEVDWETEQPCFDGICRETAKYYSHISRIDKFQDWRYITEHILYPAIKNSLLPPKYFAHDSTILRITKVSDLYKVFERC